MVMVCIEVISLDTLELVSTILVVIGALNWGLYGLGGFMSGPIDLVAILLGSVPALQNLVYIVVGLAGLHVAYAASQRM